MNSSMGTSTLGAMADGKGMLGGLSGATASAE